jgi:glycosyltransferase involved in cell wall biosynthesis
MLGCLIITDGRGEYLEQMWNSLQWDGPDFDVTVLVDDSGDDEYGQWCHELIAPTVFVHHSHRRGLAGAIASGWNALGDVDYIVHLEEDFTFPEPIPVDRMVNLLISDRQLAQVCLKRQPWSPIECALGGFMAVHPEHYTNATVNGVRCVYQSQCFSFNPCVYPGWVRNFGADIEAPLTDRLLAAGHRFAYYGHTEDEPRCVHIGEKRSVAWML